MLSIDNVNSFGGLLNFDKRVKKDLKKDKVNYVCELKIDGLSASIIYKDKRIFQISTRGDGFIGEDVTFNYELIEDIPLSLERDFCEIRGELYMRRDEFSHINKEIFCRGLKKLSNPRNAAAGTLRTLMPSRDRKLNFFAYQYFLPEIKTQKETLNRLKDDGFAVPEYRFCENIDEV
jgi:DNA ligase (NAD+)